MICMTNHYLRLGVCTPNEVQCFIFDLLLKDYPGFWCIYPWFQQGLHGPSVICNDLCRYFWPANFLWEGAGDIPMLQTGWLSVACCVCNQRHQWLHTTNTCQSSRCCKDALCTVVSIVARDPRKEINAGGHKWRGHIATLHWSTNHDV